MTVLSASCVKEFSHMTQMTRSFLMVYVICFIVTIQNLIRKTAANAAQVLLIEVTSPYKSCPICLGMQASQSYQPGFAWL